MVWLVEDEGEDEDEEEEEEEALAEVPPVALSSGELEEYGDKLPELLDAVEDAWVWSVRAEDNESPKLKLD